MSGSCAGAFVLAPVSSYLSENHGWKATVGLYAGKKFDPILECILIYIEYNYSVRHLKSINDSYLSFAF